MSPAYKTTSDLVVRWRVMGDFILNNSIYLCADLFRSIIQFHHKSIPEQSAITGDAIDRTCQSSYSSVSFHSLSPAYISAVAEPLSDSCGTHLVTGDYLTVITCRNKGCLASLYLTSEPTAGRNMAA